MQKTRTSGSSIAGRPAGIRERPIFLLSMVLIPVLIAQGCNNSTGTTQPASNAGNSADDGRSTFGQESAPQFKPLTGRELEVSIALRKKAYSARAVDGHVLSLIASKEAPDIHLFAEFPELEDVILNTSVLKREEVAKLSQLSQVKSLGLSRTNVQDDWLPDLFGMTGLENLYLSETQITDEALQHLASFPRLKMVNLNETAITDAGMTILAEHPSLETLYVVLTSFSDAGLMNLKASSSLKQVFVKGTPVTEQGIEEFRQANANCQVIVD